MARRPLSLSAALLSSAALFTFTSHAVEADSSITTLGLNGGQSGQVNGVANNGTSVGTTWSNGQETAAYWSADGTYSLIPITGANRTVSGIATDPSGETFLVQADDLTNNTTASYVYRPNQSLTTLLPLQGDDVAGANAISGDDSTIVGYSGSVGHFSSAVVWSGPNWATLTQLPALSGFSSVATDVDDDGQTIVGTSSDAGNASRAVYWQGGQIHQLDPGDLTHYSQAMSISGDGSIIAGQIQTATGADAVSFSGSDYGTITHLGSLGGTSSTPMSVDGDGGVIVGYGFNADGQLQAFRYSDGQMVNLNTALANAGVDMTGVDLTFAEGVSENGKYIGAQDASGSFSVPYLVYYDGTHAALGSGADQQASVDGVAQERAGLAVAQDAYLGLLTGDFDAAGRGNSVMVFGLHGSAMAGLRGHGDVGNGFTFGGGIADGSSEFGSTGIGNGLYAAASLRYDADDFAVGMFHPFAQLEGGYGLLQNVKLTRDYDGGIGTSASNGALASLWGRAGLAANFTSGDTVAIAGEIGERWLTLGPAAEADSSANPFPATLSGGTDGATVAKASATWTHPLTRQVNVTLRGALATTVGEHSGFTADTTGFGTLTPAAAHESWGELGGEVTMKVAGHSRLDLYAAGVVGLSTGPSAHVGVGYSYSF